MAPRCFIVRHGETEWSLNGRHTGTTDLSLTENGEKRIKATGKALVGNDRLIAPKKLVHVYVSSINSCAFSRVLTALCLDMFPPAPVRNERWNFSKSDAEKDSPGRRSESRRTRSRSEPGQKSKSPRPFASGTTVTTRG
jgi:broad specificity phosphatase PhoE